MKNIFKSLFIILFILVLTGCGKKGEEKEISLLGKDDEYYNWVYSIEDDSIVRVSNEEYYGEENSDEEYLLGGKYIFTFQALKTGKTRVKFSYVKSWDKDDEVFNYYVDIEVDKDLNIDITKELGNYLYLLKFIKLDLKTLGLDKDFYEYHYYFSDDPVEFDDYECMRLSVYDYSDNPVGYYAISGSNDYVFKVIDDEYVLLNKD